MKVDILGLWMALIGTKFSNDIFKLNVRRLRHPWGTFKPNIFSFVFLLIGSEWPTDEQQCQGVRENDMKKAPCLQKSSGAFPFLEKG